MGEKWQASSQRKLMPHGFTAVIVGEVVTTPEVMTKNPTEWPKIGCKVAVRHNEDQTSVVPIVAVGPVGEFLRKCKMGDTILVGGHLKAATGQVELFALEAKKATVQRQAHPFDLLFGGGSPMGDDD